jgi:hypothetical protein
MIKLVDFLIVKFLFTFYYYQFQHLLYHSLFNYIFSIKLLNHFYIFDEYPPSLYLIAVEYSSIIHLYYCTIAILFIGKMYEVIEFIIKLLQMSFEIRVNLLLIACF